MLANRRKHSRDMCLDIPRRHRLFSIHPTRPLCRKRLTGLSRRQPQVRLPDMWLPRRCVSTCRVAQRDRTEQHRPQKRARSTTEAASRESRGLIIAAPHPVFVSLLRSRPLSTGRRSCGGPAMVIMRPVNLGAGVPGGEGIGGLGRITRTEIGTSKMSASGTKRR